jgi:hypothetical protein
MTAVAGRASLAAGLPLLAVILAAAPAHADSFFVAQTSATAVHITITQQPASSIITASLLDDAISYAASDFDSGGVSEALAATAFPGRLVTQGPQLLCSEVFTCPVQPPDYPLLADASYPRQQRDSAAAGGSPMGSGPLLVTPLRATAQAEAAANSATTTAGTASLLAGTPGAVTVGACSATSTVQSGSRGMTVHVESVASNVTIAGLLHIAAVRAVDDITIGADSGRTDHPSITVTGVEVAGQAASIDNSGVHLAGNNGPSVSQELAAKGVAVRTVGVHRSDTTTGRRSDATGLEIDVQVPVAGVPYIPNPVPALPPPFDQIPQLPGVNANGTYVAHVTLGAVGAAAGVGSEPTFDLGGVGQLPVPPGATTVVPPGAVAPTGRDLVASLGSPQQPAPDLAPATPPALRGFVDELSRHALLTLYAVLALGTVGLFTGWRATVVLRRRPLAGGRRA